MLLLASQARAGEPKMDYWFVEHFTVGQPALPEGVSVSTSAPTTSPRGWLEVKNQTEEPLYIMSLNYKNVLVMATPDADWKTRVRLAHEAAAFLVLPERPAALSIEGLINLDKHLVDWNVFTLDLPPVNLAIPATQESELLIVYDQHVLEVPFSITYALNTRFDNGSETLQARTANLQATGQVNATATQAPITDTARVRDNIILSLAVLAVILTGGWAAWRVLRRGS